MTVRPRLLVMGTLVVLGMVLRFTPSDHPSAIDRMAAGNAIPLGVLGDSDSHAYSDDIALDGEGVRGGVYRSQTLQWTELLHRLRGESIDQGPWGRWGWYRRRAWLRSLIGLEARTPPKRDFRFNMAISGAPCEMTNPWHGSQVTQLLYLMRLAPARWARGVVVIRIGINSIATAAQLDAYARQGRTRASDTLLAGCVGHIRAAVRAIRAAHADTYIVVVGITDDSNWPYALARYPRSDQYANIKSVLDHFDDQVRALQREDARLAFFDDRAFVRAIWGGRKDAGFGGFRPFNLGGPRSVAPTKGDHPSNAVLADDHAGSVYNGLWAQALVQLLRDRFHLPLRPIEIGEIARAADPTGTFGLAPASAVTTTDKPR